MCIRDRLWRTLISSRTAGGRICLCMAHTVGPERRGSSLHPAGLRPRCMRTAEGERRRPSVAAGGYFVVAYLIDWPSPEFHLAHSTMVICALLMSTAESAMTADSLAQCMHDKMNFWRSFLIGLLSSLLVKFTDWELCWIPWAYRDLRGLVSCLLYTSPSPRDRTRSRMPSSA